MLSGFWIQQVTLLKDSCQSNPGFLSTKLICTIDLNCEMHIGTAKLYVSLLQRFVPFLIMTPHDRTWAYSRPHHPFLLTSTSSIQIPILWLTARMLSTLAKHPFVWHQAPLQVRGRVLFCMLVALRSIWGFPETALPTPI